MKQIINTMIISFFLLLGRVSGFFREITVANNFGASLEADAAILLLTLPDIMVVILMSGGFSLVVIPLIIRNPEDNFSSLFLKFTKLVFLIFSLLAILTYILQDYLFSLLAPGIDFSGLRHFDKGFILICISILIVSLSSVVLAFLSSKEKFITSYSGTLIFNISIIVSILVSPDESILFSVCIGVLTGTILKLSFQLLELYPLIYFRKNRLALIIDEDFKVKFFTAVFFISSLSLITVISKSASSNLGEGSLAMFHYALRLIEIPLAITLIPALLAFFPNLSKQFPESNIEAKQKIFNYGFRLTLLISILFCLICTFLSRELIDLIYGFGDFNEDQFSTISNSLSFIAFSLPAIGLVTFLQFLLSSNLDTKLLFFPSLISLVIHILLSFILSSYIGLYGVIFSFISTFYFLSFYLIMITLKTYKLSLISSVRSSKSLPVPILILILGLIIIQLTVSEIFSSLVLTFLACILSLYSFLYLDDEISSSLPKKVKRKLGI